MIQEQAARIDALLNKGENKNGKKFNTSENVNNSDTDTQQETALQIGKILAQQELRDLPTLDGTSTKWTSFYRSYLDSQDLFSDAANRNRLLKALKGRAMELVSGLLVTPDTIDEAIRMLKF